MRLRKFQADTMKEAVAMVKATLGPDAMIVATRTIRRGFLGSGVEVTAAAENEQPEVHDLTLPPITQLMAPPPPRMLAPPTFGSAAYAAHAAPPPPPPTQSSNPPDGLSDADVERIMAPLRSELRQLKSQLRTSHATREDESVGRELNAMRHAIAQLSQPPSGAPERLDRLAERAVLAAPSNGRVVALVGPTGAGKTTTIAKLAARAALGRRQKVALVSVDTFRVGGEEQIRIFADLIGVPLVVVRSLDGLPAAIEGLAGHARVFVDTAGRSPRDGAALDELSHALSQLPGVETHLTLPAGSTARWIDGWVARFPALRLDRFLFTKVDEADELGELVRAPVRHAKPVSFFTTGQHVPEDLEEASHGRLLDLASQAQGAAA